MNYTITFRVEARDEYKEAVAYYDEISLDAGDKFITSIDIVLKRLSILPFSAPKVAHEIRKAVIKNYPYIILYIVLDNKIEVLSVFNTHQDPKKWIENYG